MNRVYTGGTFDAFHFGHVNFLRQCEMLAGEDGEVVVALNTDEFVEKFKGKKPLLTYKEREESLLSCQYVDQVVKNTGGQDSKPTILRVEPNIIAIGSDWAEKDYYKQMDFTQEWLDKHYIILAFIPYTRGISTTELKRRLNED